MKHNFMIVISLCLFSIVTLSGFSYAGQLIYSTFLGGDSDDYCYSMALDNYRNVYLTGYTTSSTTFPITAGALDTTFNGGYKDIYVCKLNPAGSALIYATYLGGSEFEEGYGIAVDNSGNAYITGYTNSTDFPVTTNAFDTTFSLNTPFGVIQSDVFISKLNATGSTLLYSTFLGSDGGDVGNSIALDEAGNAYITGATSSPDFPTTAGAYDTTINTSGYNGDAFVTKINDTGSALVYSTFLGGSKSQSGNSIAVDTAGKSYITGYTESTNFPTTIGAYDTTFNGNNDIFVTKLNATGTLLEFSTYIGGSSYESVNDIDVDNTGNAYIIGETHSTNFPTTPGAIDVTSNGYDDVFITKFNPSGSGLIYSTYLGGAGNERGRGIAVDWSGNAFITGYTESTNFPVTTSAFNTTIHGTYTYDVFASKLNATGSSLLYSTYFGGVENDFGVDIATDYSGNAYIAGYTASSTDFPITAGSFDTTFNGVCDIFVSKLTLRPTAIEPSVWQRYDIPAK